MILDRIHIVIPVEFKGARIDKALAELLPDFSRSILERNIKKGNIFLNNRIIKPSYRVQGGEIVEGFLELDDLTDVVPESIPLDIVYEDDHIAVINKPAGMVVHPAPGHTKGTLVNALLHHFQNLSQKYGIARAGIVHRLDKNTSGLIIISKSEEAHTKLSEMFKNKIIQKKYIALVWGIISEDRALIQAPIGRSPLMRTKMQINGLNARPSETRIIVRERLEKFTLIEAMPITGRTHQIRVHLSFIKHPVVGDEIYGFKRKEDVELGRQFLHSFSLDFRHPINGEPMHFEIDLPDDLKIFLEKIK